MALSQKKYLCFTCLKESNDPIECTNCGAKIEELNMDAEFKPPVHGRLVIIVPSDKEAVVNEISSVVTHYNQKLFDNASFSNDKGNVVIDCTDVASERIIELLEEEIGEGIKQFKFEFQQNKP